MSGPLARYRLVIIVTLLLLGGIVVNACLYYRQSSDEIRRSIVEQGLPLTGDTIFSQIDQGILRPLSVAALMAHDTFLADWMQNGEISPERASRYLSAINGGNGISGSFLVSERSRRYYYAGGIHKIVSAANPHDAWYFRCRGMRQDHEINLDRDMTNGGQATMFINHRMLDDQGRLLGVIGVGLPLDQLARQLAAHEQRFRRRIYFIDRAGRVMLSSSRAFPSGKRLQELPGLSALSPAILSGREAPQRLEYSLDGNRYLLTSRFLPELGWHLLVEQNASRALQPLRASLLANLAINSAILLLVVMAVLATLQRHQRKLRQLATTDQLTGCLNRLAFLDLLPGWLRHCQRIGAIPQLLMLDIDHFKQANDRYGHQVGDRLLQETAELLRSQLRGNDLLIRWGGEEFMVLVASHGLDDSLAERLRSIVARHLMQGAPDKLTITISVGIGLWQPPETLEAAIDRVDQALYAAKQAGRNRVCQAIPAPATGQAASAER
ncbi:sensor domain-containing diguanylate cyclase [Chromobacterium subtsugae]|uniref:sensor domain-containing diguanylate cyclase n=1 Tax=Chromobacterium subtsugae TaxID=251747 RepID=UPI0007F8FD06|nr:diguanylate cyclase [Chromobacterium subtsugae]